MPRPVRELLRLVYMENVDLAHVSGADTRVGAALRKDDPSRYKSLLSAK
jgi:hypothetical protein